MKKGVQTIAGKTEIKVGVWETFRVSKWYNNTPQDVRNEAQVKWAVYNITNGKPELILEKEIGHFRFQSKAIGQKYLIVAYMYKPELSTGIEVTVIDTQKPKILGIDITDINDKPVTKKLAYGQNINVHIRTVGMVGHHLNISLWEDDVDGAGHSDKNTKVLKFDKPVRVGSKGIAHAQFMLSPNFAKMAAANSKNEGTTHEYYITVYALGELKASKNINLVYPEQRLKETKEKLEGKSKPKEIIPPLKKKVKVQPVVATPKPSKPDSRTPAEIFRDDKKKQITKVTLTKTSASQLTATIYSTNIVNKDIKFKLYEDDYAGDDLLIDQKFTISGDIMPIYIDLKKVSQSKGGTFWEEGSEQELYVDIEVLETEAHYKSATVNVDSAAMKVTEVDKSNKKVVVEEPKAEKKEDKNDCPRCKILTADEMTKVFTSASIADKDILRKAFNDANSKFGLDTCQQKAHFFAQVMEEVGLSIKIGEGESLNYKVEDLPIHFARFRVNTTKKYNKLTNGPNSLAYEYGRIEEIRNGKKVITQAANKEMIANITYANKEDNGDKDSGDGWKYRGRGIIQITFKRKYTNINRRIKDDYPEFKTIIDSDNINNLNEGTVASMAYWEEYKCSDEAKKGYTKKELDLIVDIINEDTESRAHRWINFQTCKTIFKVSECKNANPKNIEKGDINKYKIDIDKFTYSKILQCETSKKYQYDIYDLGKLTKTITLEKNDYNLLPFPETGTNWGRFGTRDSGGDNWVDEKVCAALLGFFQSLPKNDYSGTLYFNDISANDGRNIGHKGHQIGNDIDLRYPGSENSAEAVLWSKAAETFTTKDKFVETLENILDISNKWGFNKNYAYKVGIKNTTGKATAIHQDHFHLGLR